MSDRENSVVLYELRDSIARITLNRPDKRNALNDQLIEGVKKALSDADGDDNVRVVILTGAGSDFCSGADLAALQKISTASVSENLDDARSLMELFALIRQVRMPVIAAVRGRALAGGCGLALVCDLVLAESSARFGFPEVKLGFVPAMVMAILRRNVSEKKAFELIALGGEIAAAEAEPLGLINYVCEDGALEPRAQTLAQRVSKLSPSALSLSKGLLYKMDSLSFVEALESGVDVNVIARMSLDCKEGIARFLKRE
jgi:methylglutaconyl-CoA hydratase